MIDCLSNPAWINPQTDFLLLLQNMRIGEFEHFDKFFLSITILGEYWLPTLICAVVYWCFDMRAGVYLFTIEGFNILLAHLFKMLACVYRPWILNNNIHPSELAVPYAKGYSFPSGHTAMSSSVLGGLAYILKNKKAVVCLLLGLILLVGFSRLWLGVHTPQDVLGGLLIGITLVFGVKPIIDWAEKDKNRYLYLALIINILAFLALVYICCFNTYRIDYIDGEMLVNPKKSIYITIVVYGYALGLINGSFLCRKFCPYEPKEASVKRRVVRGIIGSICTLILIRTVLVYIFLNTVDIKTAISLVFAVGFAITFIYPFIFTRFNRN